MYQFLLDKIQRLKDAYAKVRGGHEDLALIDDWTREAKRLILLDHLSKHDGIKYVKEQFEVEVESINATLLAASSKEVPDIERDRMIDRRSLAQKYLGLFTDLEGQLERLEETVDSELSNPVLSSEI